MSDEFLQKWFDLSGQSMFMGMAEYADPDPARTPLPILLDWDRKDLRPFTQELLALPSDSQMATALEELRAGVHAYAQFQDVLDVPVSESSPIEMRHYPYYESIFYLREATTAALERRYLAALTLLRPFLELAVSGLYWKYRGEQDDFVAYYRWLQGDVDKPPFRTMLDWLCDNLPARTFVPEQRYNAIRQSLTSIYKSNCAYHHTPQPGESVIAMGAGSRVAGLYPFYATVIELTLVIRQLSYLYILAYPMALYPRAIHERFGYSPPVGVFIDHTAAAIIERFIGTENIQRLRDQLRSCEPVPSMLSFFEGMPKLTPHQLEKDWVKHRKALKTKSNPRDVRTRLTLAKSAHRALALSMNYRVAADTYDWVPDEVADRARQLINEWPA